MARFKAKVEPVLKRGVVFSTLLVHTRPRSTHNPSARRAIPCRQNDTRSVYILSCTLLSLPHYRSKHTTTNTHNHTCNIGHIQCALNRRVMARVIYLKIVTVVKCKKRSGSTIQKSITELCVVCALVGPLLKKLLCLPTCDP